MKLYKLLANKKFCIKKKSFCNIFQPAESLNFLVISELSFFYMSFLWKNKSAFANMHTELAAADNVQIIHNDVYLFLICFSFA